MNAIAFTHYPMKTDLTTITTRSIVFKRIETAQLQRSLINKELRSTIAKKSGKWRFEQYKETHPSFNRSRENVTYVTALIAMILAEWTRVGLVY